MGLVFVCFRLGLCSSSWPCTYDLSASASGAGMCGTMPHQGLNHNLKHIDAYLLSFEPLWSFIHVTFSMLYSYFVHSWPCLHLELFFVLRFSSEVVLCLVELTVST